MGLGADVGAGVLDDDDDDDDAAGVLPPLVSAAVVGSAPRPTVLDEDVDGPPQHNVYTDELDFTDYDPEQDTW